MSNTDVNVGLTKFGHLDRPSKPFSSPLVERPREVMARVEDDYQIPSSNLCLSQAPICISVPIRYSQYIKVDKLIQQ